MSNENRDFKGVWIPKDVWLNIELTWIEKMFLVEIDSLDNENHCYASNAYFAEFFKVSKARCTQIIKSLEAKNYLTIHLQKKGKQVIKRTLKINKAKFNNQPTKGDITYSKQGSKKTKQGIKNIKQPIKNIKQGIKNIKGNIIIQSNNTDNNTILNENSNFENQIDYKDFNEVIKKYPDIPLANVKAAFQNHFNILTFSEAETKTINNSIIYKIKSELQAFNKKNGINTKVTNKSIVEAFKMALNNFLEINGNDTNRLTISYFVKCLNPNLYIKELQQTDSDLEQYKAVVKKIFSHYHRFTKSDLNNLKTIIKAIEETGSKDVLFDFKFIMNNLPDYILESMSLQSISYLANKINDLLRTCSLEAKIRSHEQFILISQPFGEKRAYEILTKRLTKNL